MNESECAVPPDPLTLGCKHSIGGYKMGVVESKRTGYDLATYTWAPENGGGPVGVVFLLHGVFGHSCFEWLTPDVRNHRCLLRDSLVQLFLEKNFAVVAHDHPGHGRSSGLHAYVDSLDIMRDAAIDVTESFNDDDDYSSLPKFLCGMSMGATTSILVAKARPDLFKGFCLVSPAVRPPDDMFGWYGTFLRAINKPLGWLVPKLPVLNLPSSYDPKIRDAVHKDPLVYKGAMRVKLGQEFLRVYDEINTTADEIQFGKVAIFVGKNDNVVSPDGIKQFFERIPCEDKHLFSYDGLAHEILREPGCDKVRIDLANWILQRLQEEGR